ncbi:hypothetical protein Tco_0351660 [Tanacetum coccineum]
MLWTKMVLEEEDRVENFIGGLPDNIQGNVTAVEPTRVQDAVRIANNLMDQKLKGSFEQSVIGMDWFSRTIIAVMHDKNCDEKDKT